MEDRKLISEDQFDDAVVDILAMDALRGAPEVALHLEMLSFAQLANRLFRSKKEEVCDAEEALKKAVDDHDSQH